MDLDLPYIRLTPDERERLEGTPNIIHWTRGNVIIMFQGKAANTAIKAAILEAEGGVDRRVNIHADSRLNYVTREYAARFRKTVPVVAVVRRPWDRIVSFWRDKIAGRTPEAFTCDYVPGAYADMPFPEFARLALKIAPCAEMGTFLADHLGQAWTYLTLDSFPIPTRIFRFEEVTQATGWRDLRRMTARAWDLPEELPRVNMPRHPLPVLDPSEERQLRLETQARYYLDYKAFNWSV